MSEREKCYWCGGDHDPKDCPVAPVEKLRRCYRAIAGPLIEGDYIGSMRGEVNVCLNVIHFLKAFEQATKEMVSSEKYRAIRERAYRIRRDRYGKLLW